MSLLTPVFLRNIEGHTLKQSYLYLNGEISFFGSEHLPYGILAIVMLMIFNFVPMVFLLLSPCQCFQRCLNKCRLNITFLHPLIDTFQGCYRHQYRYFAGIYLMVRFLFLITLVLVNYTTAYSLFGFYFLILAITVILLMPYKENKIDSTFFLVGASVSFISGLYYYLRPAEPQIQVRPLFIIFISPLIVFPTLYGPIILIAKVLPRKTFTLVKSCWQYVHSKIKGDEKADDDDAFLQQLEQEHSHN